MFGSGRLWASNLKYKANKQKPRYNNTLEKYYYRTVDILSSFINIHIILYLRRLAMYGTKTEEAWNHVSHLVLSVPQRWRHRPRHVGGRRKFKFTLFTHGTVLTISKGYAARWKQLNAACSSTELISTRPSTSKNLSRSYLNFKRNSKDIPRDALIL